MVFSPVDLERALASPPLAMGMTAQVFALGDAWVLKRFHPGTQLDEVMREYLVNDAAHRWSLIGRAGELRIPAVEAPMVVEGAHCLVCERMPGETYDALLTRSATDELDALAGRLARWHVAVHETGPRDHPSLAALPLQRDMLGWAIDRAVALGAGLRQRVVAALSALPGVVPVLCHGDFHPHNVLWSPGHPPAVIDWHDGSAGDAAADVARSWWLLSFGESAQHVPESPQRQSLRLRFAASYLAHYAAACGEADFLARVARWQPVVAAARLSEGVSNAERAQLLHFVRTALG